MSTAQRILTLVVLALLTVGGLFFLSTLRRGGEQPLSPRDATEGSSSTPVVQSHRGYSVEVVSGADGIQPGRETIISYRIRNNTGEVLKDFAVAHEKIMHFIIVRNDLQHFQHLHPDFDPATGTFTIALTFPTDGPYRLFPDFTPEEENPQKLPVTVTADVNVGNLQRYTPELLSADTETKKTVGTYDITTEMPKPVRAQTPVTYRLRIEKNGQLVTNLEPYLGALGHSVILKAETLEFIHTHAEKAGGTRGPEIEFSTTFPEPGLYKLFAQFQHEGKVVTTTFVVFVEIWSGDGGGTAHPRQHMRQ